jgi:uncharacterized membrane protein
MNAWQWSRVLHVLGVVIWIGGVGFVTLVLLPAVRTLPDVANRHRLFELAEGRFAWWARGATLVTGLSGFYMLYLTDGWSRFTQSGQWWLHAMVAVWAIFTLMLFVLEPLVLHRMFARLAQRDPRGLMRRIQRMHVFLLAISLITVAGAVAGSHGGNLLAW